MALNRIQHAQATARSSNRPMAQPANQSSAPLSVPDGFVVCPPGLATVNAWQQEIYRLAYERAKAAAAVPRHHRTLFSVWN